MNTTSPPMSAPDQLVVGPDGLHGTARPRPGSTAFDVSLADGRQLVVPADLLRPQADGSLVLILTSMGLTPAPVTIPLVAEQVSISKRRVETGRVRVTKSIETVDEVVDVPGVREDVVVERVPCERIVDAAPPVRQEGDTTIVSVVEEVLLVEKRLMVREEIRLTTRRTETHDPRTIPLRREVAHVERTPPGAE